MKVAQARPTLCDPMDCTVHRILQARILEWVTFPFSRGSSQPRDQTHVSCIAGRFFTSWATREAPGQMCICDSVLFLMLFPLFKITFPIFSCWTDCYSYLKTQFKMWTTLQHFYFFGKRCSPILDSFSIMVLITYLPCWIMDFPGSSAVKNLPIKQDMQIQSLSWEDPLEKGMVTHSSILAW